MEGTTGAEILKRVWLNEAMRPPAMMKTATVMMCRPSVLATMCIESR